MMDWVKITKKNKPDMVGEYVVYIKQDDEWDIADWDGHAFSRCGNKVKPTHWLPIERPNATGKEVE